MHLHVHRVKMVEVQSRIGTIHSDFQTKIILCICGVFDAQCTYACCTYLQIHTWFQFACEKSYFDVLLYV